MGAKIQNNFMLSFCGSDFNFNSAKVSKVPIYAAVDCVKDLLKIYGLCDYKYVLCS